MAGATEAFVWTKFLSTKNSTTVTDGLYVSFVVLYT